MRMLKFAYRLVDMIVSLFLICLLCVVCAYSLYALWDNNQVYAQADNVQSDLLQYKTQAEEEKIDSAELFAQLQAVNPDICAWITMDNTAIDYPVLIGESNTTYLNKDAYGNFALAGSIFMDTRNSRDFSDAYTLIYGHHMSEHRMFGDLELYEDETFFMENTTGTLMLTDTDYRIETIAVMKIAASESVIFDPTTSVSDITEVLSYAEEEAMYIREDVLKEAREMEDAQVIALSTCSGGFTDARTVLVCLIRRM